MTIDAITIESGVPVPVAAIRSGSLPLSDLGLAQSIWIPANHPSERARWRAIADKLAHAHSLETGRGYLVRSCRRKDGDAERGVRIWCVSLPAEFVRVAI